jgi:molybdopterin-guanine dinucleotide biosynthesis protein A
LSIAIVVGARSAAGCILWSAAVALPAPGAYVDPMIRPSRNTIAGVVLAGGLSRRMGGGDKGLLGLGSGTMLDAVLARLAPQVASVVLNANGDPTRFAELGLPVVPDPIEGFVGPLAGVLAGMRWAAGRPPITHVLSVSSDAPFLPADLAERLAERLPPTSHGIAIARSGGELHPVIGLWPVALADDLEAALRDGVRKVLAWTDRHGTLPVDFPMLTTPAGVVDPFFNANTPAELDEARRLLASLGTP